MTSARQSWYRPNLCQVLRLSTLGSGLLVAVGCSSSLEEYRCTTNSQCIVDEEQGICHSSGYCAFVDFDECDGYRFGKLSGERSDLCVNAKGEGDAGPSQIDAGVDMIDATPGVADASVPDATSCPTNYIENANGSCYRVVSTSATWTAAEADCEDDASGAHLIVIDDATEDAMVANFHWIGYTERVTEGEFLWVNGSSGTYPGFASGEPVAGGGACVVTRSDGWHDDTCIKSKVYVCEYDGMPAIAITY